MSANVEFYQAGTGDHGCRGEEVIVAIDSDNARTGIVVESISCSYCWQVGHDGSTPFAPGTIVSLRSGYTSWAAMSRMCDIAMDENNSESEAMPLIEF